MFLNNIRFYDELMFHNSRDKNHGIKSQAWHKMSSLPISCLLMCERKVHLASQWSLNLSTHLKMNHAKNRGREIEARSSLGRNYVHQVLQASCGSMVWLKLVYTDVTSWLILVVARRQSEIVNMVKKNLRINFSFPSLWIIIS